MPFSKTDHHTEDHWTSHYESFLKPMIEEIPGLEARRARPLGGDLLGQIITNLITATIVVADLTDNNPNVYWELGVRHSFNYRTVLIDESPRRPPFDVATIGVHFYGKKGSENPRFKQEFQDELRDCLKHPTRPDSPVFQTISGRSSLFQLIRKDEALRRVGAVISEMERNVEVIAAIEHRIDVNRKRRRSSVVTGRLRSAAVELLITDRYLEESEKFFQLAEEYFDWILRINETLNDWRQSRTRVEGWLSKNTPRALRQIDRFRAGLTGAMRNLAGAI